MPPYTQLVTPALWSSKDGKTIQPEGLEASEMTERQRAMLLDVIDERLRPQAHGAMRRRATLDVMRAGRGVIRIDFDAVVPRGGGERRLVFENHHFSGIAEG